MEWLEITPAEERELTTLISTGEKYRRNNERRRALYESVKVATHERREQRDQIIVTGHKSGLTHNQIIVYIKRLTGNTASLRTVQYVLRKKGF